MEFTYTLAEIPEIAKKVLAYSTSKTFLFYGKMGSGKTTLIKELLKELGVDSFSGSPTFSIVNEYDTIRGSIYHFDFYRIENIHEAYDMGLEEYLQSDSYLFMEWPEQVESLLPEDACRIHININNNGSRTLSLRPVK